MELSVVIAIVALIALAMSGTSAYVLYKWVRPIVKKGMPVIEKAGQFLEKDTGAEVKKLIENDAQHMIAETMEGMFITYAPRMQKAFLVAGDQIIETKVRPIIQESMDALGEGLGQSVGAVVNAILQHEGAVEIGSSGGKATLKNAQIRAGKKKLILGAVEKKAGPMVAGVVANMGLDDEFLDLQEENPEIAAMIINKLADQEGQPAQPDQRRESRRTPGGWYS